MTLTEFLLARISEDEKRNYVHVLLCHRTNLDYEYDEDSDRTEPYPCNCGYPQRILAECEAKRRIVEMERSECGGYEDRPDQHYPGQQSYPCDGCSAAESYNASHDAVLQLLALPYADHPDYRQEWRP